MQFHKLAVLTGATLLAIWGSPAMAQYDSHFDDAALQGRATITIPFGGHQRSTAAKPKLAFGLRAHTQRPAQNIWMMADDRVETREFNLALTLQKKPTLLINEQELHLGDLQAAHAKDDGGLDGYDKTVLTVIAGSLVIIVGAVAVSAAG